MPRIYRTVGPQSNKALTPETETKAPKTKAPKTKAPKSEDKKEKKENVMEETPS